MAEALEVVIPRETVNDDVVTLARWHAANGEKVRAGVPLFEFETSKTVIEVEAPHEGHLEIVCPEGEEIGVGEIACRLHAQPFAAADAAPRAARPAGGAAGSQAISRKARLLIEERGLDPALFSHLEVVREADVIRVLESGAQPAKAGAAKPGPGAPPPPGRAKGGLHDLMTASRERGHGPVWLAFNYVFRNWLLGMLVRVAPRGINLPLHRLRGVKIGRGCYIDPTAIVETAYPENITLGDDVRITAGAILMTHIKAPHYLRESGMVPNVLKPIVLEDHSFIGVNSVIMPGVRVGRASVVASGAVVLADVPPYTMVAGNPARVVKRFPAPGAEGG